MLGIKEQRCTWCEERPSSDVSGDQPRWDPVSDNCAEDGDAKGWVLDVQNLYPLSLKAMGSDEVINHHRAPLTYVLKSRNIPIFTDSFHGNKDRMSRKRKEVGGETFCYLLRYIFPQYFIMKFFKHVEKLKELHNELPCTHLDATMNILL